MENLSKIVKQPFTNLKKGFSIGKEHGSLDTKFNFKVLLVNIPCTSLSENPRYLEAKEDYNLKKGKIPKVEGLCQKVGSWIGYRLNFSSSSGVTSPSDYY